MLVVCALALVVAAAVFLVIGLAGGDVGDLYISMALCVASLVVVAVSARLSRSTPAVVADEAPDPILPEGAEGAGETVPLGADTEPEHGAIAATPSALVDDPTAGLSDRLAKDPEQPVEAASIWAAEPAPQVEVESAPVVEADPAPVVEAEAGGADDLPAGAPFPIADYDDLAVEQILPLVPKLWPEEVPLVAARERATKARPAVLDALATAIDDPSLAFPIAEYDTLDTEQITALLDRLDTAALATVQVAERAGPARVGVLVAVANRLAARG